MVLTRLQSKKLIYKVVLINRDKKLFSSYGIIKLYCSDNNNCIIKKIIDIKSTKKYDKFFTLEDLTEYNITDNFILNNNYFKNREDAINYFLKNFETDLTIKISSCKILLYNPLKINIYFDTMNSIYNDKGYLININYNGKYLEELTFEEYLNGFILYSYGQELLYFPDKKLIDFGFDL